jgi:hypothetical protein
MALISEFFSTKPVNVTSKLEQTLLSQPSSEQTAVAVRDTEYYVYRIAFGISMHLFYYYESISS